MKKLILTTIVYDMPGQTELVTRQFLVAINSSKRADENHDTSAAVNAAREWWNKSSAYESGAKCISIIAAPTIDADNPDPGIYTEADLVTFGNYLLSDDRTERIWNGVSKSDSSDETRRRLNSVSHADLENWKHRATA